ncbi:hypothetical protein FMEXI_10349 [Fusarium mexicanum]|uniref:Uncharacterized protein n=1 Tax=Fusarium mexicanum TaxID=751941 RepID=A0A8H5II50_9HYPO|nr:hypothetical protein FMEXI_10349 [Fusarium mexicanum]
MDYSSILSKPKSFFGKQKVWMARGEDLALFNTHRPNIRNLLRHSCIPESSHNLWIGLYRVGITEVEAKTFVVVSCTDRRIRKLTRDILSSCPIFQPGQALDRFKVISKATLPETACEPQQTMQDEEELEYEPGMRKGDKGKNIAKDEYKTIRISPSITGDSYLCRQVQARQVSGKGEVRFQTATAGPLISLDGRTYQLTVAHVVDFQEKNTRDATESITDDWDDWDDESDDDTDSGCSVDEDVAYWDILADEDGSPASEVSDDEVPESLSSNSASEVATQQNESGAAITEATSIDKEPIDELVHPACSPHLHPSERPILEEFLIDHASSYLGFAPGSENCQISTEMDYLLIPIRADLQAEVCTSKSAELVQISEAFDLRGITEPRPIIIATASLGYMGGVIFPASSLLRPPGARDFQALYCIKSGNAMPKGTSGSAVFDMRTGLLAGYIVLGCPEKSIWYMVPILDVLNDLEDRFRQNGKCQTRLDVDTAMRSSNLGFPFDTSWDSLCRVFETSPGIISPLKDQEGQLQIASQGTKSGKWGMIHDSMTNAFKVFPREGQSSSNDSSEALLRPDEWRNLFGYNQNSLEGDKQLFSRFSTLDCALLKAMVFMSSCPKAAPGEQKTKTSRSHGTSFEATGESCNEDGITQPEIRVEHIFSKKKALDGRKFLAWLKEKRLPNSHDTTTHTPRCIHVRNIDPSSVRERDEATQYLPVRGFQELFSNLVAKAPSPMINLTQDTWFGSTFQIVFSLPFLVIASHDAFGKTSVTGRAALRSSVSLSFLYQQQKICESRSEKEASQPQKTYLYHTTWSTIVTGTSERYWTAACLSEGFDEPPAVSESSNDAILLSSSLGDHTGDIKRTMSPRAYALSALAMQLEKITEYHRHIQLTLDANFKLFVSNPRFCGRSITDLIDQEEKTNLLSNELLLIHNQYWIRISERFETFLLKDLYHWSDGAPGHPLWGSFYQDLGAPESVQRIQKSLGVLSDIQNHLNILDARMKKLTTNQDQSRIYTEDTIRYILTASDSPI